MSSKKYSWMRTIQVSLSKGPCHERGDSRVRRFPLEYNKIVLLHWRYLRTYTSPELMGPFQTNKSQIISPSRRKFKFEQGWLNPYWRGDNGKIFTIRWQLSIIYFSKMTWPISTFSHYCDLWWQDLIKVPKYWKPVYNVWLIFCCICVIRNYFIHIGNRCFRWRVAQFRPKFSIHYLLLI